MRTGEAATEAFQPVSSVVGRKEDCGRGGLFKAFVGVFSAGLALPLRWLVRAYSEFFKQRVIAGTFGGNDEVAALTHPVEQAFAARRVDVAPPVSIENEDAAGCQLVERTGTVDALQRAIELFQQVFQRQIRIAPRLFLRGLSVAAGNLLEVLQEPDGDQRDQHQAGHE